MKITFLGTNGWYDTQTGNTISTLLETDEFNLIFDAGNGLYKLNQYINFKKPTSLFISHLHLDHIEGLHTLARLNQRMNLNIYCSKEHLEKLKFFLNSPFTVNPENLLINVKIFTFEEKEYKMPFPFVVKKLLHKDNSFGFRVVLDEKIITYCCDTAICENDKVLSKDADLLIHECSSFERLNFNDWGHSSPEEIAEMAVEQGVKKLALTHFSANIYSSIEKREVAEKLAKKIFFNSFTTKDDLQINI